MANRAKFWGVVLLSFSIIGASVGCTAGNENAGSGQQQASSVQQGTSQAGPQANSVPGGVQALGNDNVTIPLYSENGAKYVPLRALTDVLEFTSDWDPATNTMKIGDTDDPYVLTINSTNAQKDGDPVTLPAAPVLRDGAAYLPVSALADLMRDVMSYDVQNDRLVIYPSNDTIVKLDDSDQTVQTGDELAFADDPNDPFQGPIPEADTGPAAILSGGITDISASAAPQEAMEALPAAAKNIDINAMIRTGMRYIGVRYQFGAAPYPRSGRFDCSTFTQYVFGKFGVHLPRLARQQATRGTTVSRKNLRKGDLVFFYVPGRFKSNRVVGHVGIYIGNGKMLHCCPLPRRNGVQISNINTAYWKKTFLVAKRVAY